MAPKIAVIYYSTYGHIAKMAQKVVEGVKEAGGDVHLFQVPELLSQDVLDKMHAPPKDASVPIADPHTLADYDGFVFGFPTRFGMMCAQFKAFLDATGGLWAKGALVGKPCSMFTSTASQGSGQETTIMTAVTQLAHHGMIFVPSGYSFGSDLFQVTAVQGGGPWGPGTFASGDGSRQPNDTELAYAKYQGSYLTKVAAKLCA